METWVTGVGLRPGGKLPDTPPNPKAVARHSSIPTIPNWQVSADSMRQFLSSLPDEPAVCEYGNARRNLMRGVGGRSNPSTLKSASRRMNELPGVLNERVKPVRRSRFFVAAASVVDSVRRSGDKCLI